ncbi:helix-turn-helix domain-containing protein [Streptomyces sp. URMC 126]|uniref:helix-turn-helix domain-containing protein n=1 Tax=Streptomyces sp. URMC 126 TaxID=3423401 RepID=UPI003F1AC7F7
MAPASGTGPLTARRRLGAELRTLRDRQGLTTEEVGDHLGCHNSKVSRIENGKRSCTKRDFETLMELYGVGEPLLTKLTELMIRGKQRVPPWWHAYRDVISANYNDFLAYEADAVHGREYQPLLIPGSLQTADYARAVTGVSYAALGPDQVDSLVEVRMRRQDRLREDDPLTFQAVVTEAALRLRVGGPAVMRGQLKHLCAVSRLDNVSIRVIPFEAGERGASTGSFVLFSSGKNASADVAFTESAENTAWLREDPLTLRRLTRLFDNLSAAALSEDDSRELAETIRSELPR